MAPERQERRLAAILAADMVGYSRLMEADERGTIARQKAHREELIDPKIAEYNGRIVKTTGDGLLVEFASVVDAVECAVVIQRTMVEREADTSEDQRIKYRVGINLGDIVIDEDDIYGDGVNIAARLQELAEPGGVYLSGTTYDHLKTKVEVGYEALGQQRVKNIEEPIRVYRVLMDPERAGEVIGETKGAQADRQDATTSRPELKPTVVLLPFEALGEDKQTRVMSAAISQEIASSLANLTGISLITATDKADYVAKGSIQTLGGQFRATVQLLDQLANKLFWSDRFDGDLADMFKTLDDLAMQISTELRYEIYERETEKSKARPIEQQSNEELMGQAGYILLGSKRTEYERSVNLIDRVIDRDPDNFMALGIRAWGAMVEVVCGYREVPQEDGETSLRLARRAVELNERSDFAHMILGSIHLYLERDISAAIREAERSLELNPNYALAMATLGLAMIFADQPEEGLGHCLRAVEANPRFPANNWFMEHVSLGHFMRGDHSAAIDWARRADQRQRDVPRCLLTLITASWHAGQPEMARKDAERLLHAFPDFRMSDLRRWPFQDPEHWDRFVRGLTEAGLPM